MKGCTRRWNPCRTPPAYPLCIFMKRMITQSGLGIAITSIPTSRTDGNGLLRMWMRYAQSSLRVMAANGSPPPAACIDSLRDRMFPSPSRMAYRPIPLLKCIRIVRGGSGLDPLKELFYISQTWIWNLPKPSLIRIIISDTSPRTETPVYLFRNG